MIKNILFDWDGTLVDSLNLWLKTLTKVFTKFNVEISREEIIDRIFGVDKKIVNIDKRNLEDFKIYYDREVQNWMPRVSLNPNVMKTLVSLRSMLKKMAIVSSSSRKPVLMAMKNLKIEKYFDFILGIEDVEKPKPDSEIVLKAILKLKAKKEETIIIGDSYNDILSGTNGGIKTVLYLPESNQKFYNIRSKKLLSSQDVISNFSELLKIVGE